MGWRTRCAVIDLSYLRFMIAPTTVCSTNPCKHSLIIAWKGGKKGSQEDEWIRSESDGWWSKAIRSKACLLSFSSGEGRYTCCSWEEEDSRNTMSDSLRKTSNRFTRWRHRGDKPASPRVLFALYLKALVCDFFYLSPSRFAPPCAGLLDRQHQNTLHDL